MRVLLLGGTAEARALAKTLHPHVEIISSLAGRVPDPALPVGPVRIGGFGGVDGLRRWLQDERIDAVVDATHPFAATMTAHAAEACAELRMPHLVLARPAWAPGDALVVESDTAAAETVAQQGYSRVFLTTGRSGAKAFAGSDAWFLIRAVTAPDDASLPRHHRLLLSRGPYHYDDEFALLRRAPYRRPGDQEQRRRHDPGEVGCRSRAGDSGGDGGAPAAAGRGDGGGQRGRGRRMGCGTGSMSADPLRPA